MISMHEIADHALPNKSIVAAALLHSLEGDILAESPALNEAVVSIHRSGAAACSSFAKIAFSWPSIC